MMSLDTLSTREASSTAKICTISTDGRRKACYVGVIPARAFDCALGLPQVVDWDEHICNMTSGRWSRHGK